MHSHILKEYVAGTSILSLAKKYNFPPSLLARSVVENITSFQKKRIKDAMKDPFVKLKFKDVILDQYQSSEPRSKSSTETECAMIDPFSGLSMDNSTQVTRLAREVVEATNSDPLYGPRFDKERNYVGIEYEMILERALRSMGIPLETEEELRARGTSRTPDILFSCPVAIKVPKRVLSLSSPKRIAENSVAIASTEDEDYVWKMICWIDSKALFGDVKTHQTSVLPQAETYVHRFGPGLILYWFGHAPIVLLGTGHGGDVFVAGWDIPKEFMLPTGHLARDGCRIFH